jgi:uncharacterized membrane protein
MSATQTEWAGGPDPELKLALPGRSCPAGDGWKWIADGWKLFARAPVMWIISIVIIFVVALCMSLIPIIGSIGFQLLNPAIAAGFVVACRVLERGGDFELEHLFAGFKNNFGSLVVIGLIVVAAGVVMLLIFGAFVGFSILTAFLTGDVNNMVNAVVGSALMLMLGTLIVLALLVPLMMAYWFAPALVILHGMQPVDAMKASFVGCLRNVVPFLVYGVIMTIFSMLATIPIFLGFLVWVPVTIASTYAAYRDIFTETVAAPVPAV